MLRLSGLTDFVASELELGDIGSGLLAMFFLLSALSITGKLNSEMRHLFVLFQEYVTSWPNAGVGPARTTSAMNTSPLPTPRATAAQQHAGKETAVATGTLTCMHTT